MSSFANFRKELVEAIGEKNIIDDPKILEEYSKDYSLVTARKPFLVLKPSSVEEVSQVVKVANKYLIPVVPRSSQVGFYGGAVPGEGGVIVDLSRMNKVLDIDERNRLVKFEPGVTWGKLQEELAKHDLMALNPLLPHPLKSALTSHLERERSLVPKQEYQEPLYSVEVVLPNGDIFRTGLAAFPFTKGKIYTPHGPGTISYRRVIQGAQGTLGIVTWGAAKVEYLPKIQKLYFLPFQNMEDGIEAIYQITRKIIGNECFLLNDFNLALILASLTGKLEDFEKLRAAMPLFTVVLCLAGQRRLPEERIAYEEEALLEIAMNLGFEPLPTVADIAGIEKLLMSVLRTSWPEDKTYWKFGFKGLSRDIFFLTTLDNTPTYTSLMYEIAEKNEYPAREIGVYVQPLEQGRACYCEYGLHVKPDVPEEIDLVDMLWTEASETLISNGAFFSRPYGAQTDMVYGRSAAYYTAMKRLKGAFDPNRIMNPGKLGL